MKIVKQLDMDEVVFIDIETVRSEERLEEGTPLYDAWEYKMRYSREAESFEGSLIDQFQAKAALYAEFAKVVCITIGRIKEDKIILKSYSGSNELELLTNFCDTINKLYARNKRTRFCGHAIIGFDIPFLMRRCLVNGVDLPVLLDTADLKPWEVNSVDTLNLWKGTGFYGASLLSIATAFGLPSPKKVIQGSETSDVYWYDVDGVEKITRYCERDVVTVANIIRKIRKEELVEPELSDIKVESVPLMEKIFNSGKITTAEKTEVDKLLEGLEAHEMEAAKDILEVTLPKVPRKMNKKS